MQSRRHIAAERGFSLMEVMIAATVTAMMGGLAWASMHTAFEAKEMVEQEAERTRQIRSGLTRIAREVSMAFLSPHFDSKRYRGDNTDRPTFFTGQKDRLFFTSFSHQRLMRDAKESDQCVLEYRLGRDPDDKRSQSILRRVKTVLDDQSDRGGSEDVLVDHVKELNFDFWDPKKREWVHEWDTRRNDHPDDLPDLVRIQIVVSDERGKDQKFSTESRIFITGILPR
jgi:general secretion pathway protein J